MPAPAVSRLKITLGGQIAGAAWSTSLYTQGGAAVPSQANLDLFATAAATTWRTRLGLAFASMNFTSTTLSRLRVDYLPAGSNSSALSSNGTVVPTVGGTDSRSAASQCMVLSLYTATISRRGRGRMYYPATGNLPGGSNDYAFSNAQVSTWASQHALWFADLADIGDTDFGVPANPVVQSLTAGAAFEVTSARADSRPDRIEHREKALPWFIASTPYSPV